jgi:hypothetical protein
MASPRLRADPAVRRRRAVATGAALVALVAVLYAVAGGGSIPMPPSAGVVRPIPGYPFGYVPERAAAFVARATSGSAQVLFTKSPGGALATAARVAAWRPAIDAAVRGTGVDPNLLEGLVFVESAGRPDVIAGNDPAAASGLTQILAETGQSLLGMHIDLGQSRRLTGQIAAAAAAGNGAKVRRLERRRAAVDARFDPRQALAATVRYLTLARQRFGRADLAIVSYHMGIGNLQQVLADYDGGTSVPYAQLYFDTSPLRHAAAWRLLSGLGDDSSLYYWRVLGAEQIMRLYRTDRAALAHLAGLEVGYPSTALVLHPPGHVVSFADPSAVSGAYGSRTLVPLPRNAGQLHLSYAAGMGALAHRLGAPAALYRGLRPGALALLVTMAGLVHRISGARAPMIVHSTVLDARYDRLLGFDDPPATTGYTFQIERTYASPAQADAFQFVLDRLQALNLISWIRGTTAIEITAASDAGHVVAHGL